jgi:hypothetical protein
MLPVLDEEYGGEVMIEEISLTWFLTILGAPGSPHELNQFSLFP